MWIIEYSTTSQIRYIGPPRMRDHFDRQTMMYLLNSKVHSGWESEIYPIPLSINRETLLPLEFEFAFAFIDRLIC